jgi:hypothetical protein
MSAKCHFALRITSIFFLKPLRLAAPERAICQIASPMAYPTAFVKILHETVEGFLSIVSRGARRIFSG